MEGKGKIEIYIRNSERNRIVLIDVHDSGKGIPPAKFKHIFRPGYSTKKYGWGLGLTLAKRIVEEYHHGKIFVVKSSQKKRQHFQNSNS